MNNIFEISFKNMGLNCLIPLSLLLFFGSCQKEPISSDPVQKDISMYNKNYLLEVSTSYTNTNDNVVETQQFDLVLECKAVDDTLRLLGFNIPVDSNRQNVFDYDVPPSYPYNISNTNIQVEFSDNYNQISISYSHTSNYSGGVGSSQTTLNKSYQGLVSTLLPSAKPHTDAALLTGAYVLQLNETHGNNGTVLIDTLYTDTMNVSFDDHLNIDARSYDYESFHSFYQSEFSSDNGVVNTALFCQNDSLHLDYYTISQGGQDTLHSIFDGRKL